jgi:hypothetical protein
MGVFVLGMHRSGTSAVTRVVNLLGVPIGRADSLMPVQPDNPAGFWEHLGLMDVNDAVLARLGGTWDAPPDPPGVAADVDDLRERARAEFAATYDTDHWVFKDPRVSLLLPFWRDLLGDGHVGIVVLRNPLDIAASLARRNRFAVSYSLALWEHYTRTVLSDSAGLPVLVVDYDALLDDPQAATGALAGFLAAHHQLAGTADTAAIEASLAAGLRHSRHDHAALADDPRVTAEQRGLYGAAAALTGAHDRFDAGALPSVSVTTPVLLRARRDPSTAELRTVDDLCRQLGNAEAAVGERTAEASSMRATVDGVHAALGYTEIGRLEQVALGAARRARRLQQRLARR